MGRNNNMKPGRAIPAIMIFMAGAVKMVNNKLIMKVATALPPCSRT